MLFVIAAAVVVADYDDDEDEDEDEGEDEDAVVIGKKTRTKVWTTTVKRISPLQLG